MHLSGGGMAKANGIPTIGLGTFGLTGEPGTAAMKAALDTGYRHLDTAQSYGTEENVGRAIAASGLDRDDVFVTTKVTEKNLSRIGESIDESLAAMRLDRADLVLIHWPAPDDAPPVRDYIDDLARLQDSGRTRLIGVSNFTRRHVDEAIAEIGEGRLTTNQVERHLFLQNRVLADHCHDAGLVITAYKPLAGAAEGAEPELDRVAEKHGATATQVALAFLLAEGSVVIPKSADPARQESNLAASDLALDADDMDALRRLDRGERHIAPSWGPDWD